MNPPFTVWIRTRQSLITGKGLQISVLYIDGITSTIEISPSEEIRLIRIPKFSRRANLTTGPPTGKTGVEVEGEQQPRIEALPENFLRDKKELENKLSGFPESKKKEKEGLADMPIIEISFGQSADVLYRNEKYRIAVLDIQFAHSFFVRIFKEIFEKLTSNNPASYNEFKVQLSIIEI